MLLVVIAVVLSVNPRIFLFTGSCKICPSFSRLRSLSTTASWTWCSSSSPSSGECHGVTLSGSCHGREFSPPEHSANPPHLLSNSSSRPLGKYVATEEPVCALSSASVHFTHAVVTCGSSHPPHTIACGQLGDVTDLQASTVG